MTDGSSERGGPPPPGQAPPGGKEARRAGFQQGLLLGISACLFITGGAVWLPLGQPWFSIATVLVGTSLSLLLYGELTAARRHVDALRLERSVLHQQRAELQQRSEHLERNHQRLSGERTRYMHLVEHAFDGLLRIQDGLVQEANDAFAQLVDRSVEQVQGYPWHAFFALSEVGLEEIFRSGHEVPIEAELKTSGTTATIVEIYARPLPLDDGGGVLVGVRDVSARKRLEEARLRSERLETLGLLAGGLAHDFNNLLTRILGNLDLARSDPSQTIDTVHALAEAMNAGLHARQLTGHLLAFTGSTAAPRRTLHLTTLLREATERVPPGSRLSVRWDLAKDLSSIQGDRTQLLLILENLLARARDEMPEGGTVHIRARNVHLNAGEKADLPAGQYVAVSVRDEGPALLPARRLRIFDPHLALGEGVRGIGLASSLSVMEAHQGHIEVNDQYTAGTEITFWLPATPQQKSRRPRTSGMRIKQQGHVIIMDDEPAIRRVLRRMLERRGFSVADFSRGEDVLEADPTEAPTFVVLDLAVKGGMGGVETLKALRQRFPGLKAVVSSGYANLKQASEPRFADFDAVLSKPYVGDDLARVIDEVLGEGSAQARVAEGE